MAEAPTINIDELVTLYNDSFSDPTKYHAFAQKCEEHGVQTYINPALLGFPEYKPMGETQLRDRWQLVIDDTILAMEHQKLLQEHQRKVEAKALEEKRQAQKTLDDILKKARDINNYTLGQLREWYDGKHNIFLSLFLFAKENIFFFFATIVCLDYVGKEKKNCFFFSSPLCKPRSVKRSFFHEKILYTGFYHGFRLLSVGSLGNVVSGTRQTTFFVGKN